MTWKRPPARSKQYDGANPSSPRETVSVGASSAPTMRQAEKLAPLRSENYRRFVASHACFACGLHGSSQCAHANEGKGMAMKVCDRRTFPLCFPCHSNLDNTRGMTRDQRRLIERAYVDRMQAIARASKRPEIPLDMESVSRS